MAVLFFPTAAVSIDAVKNLALLGDVTTEPAYNTHHLHTFIYLKAGDQGVHGVLMEANASELATLDRMFADSPPLTKRMSVRVHGHPASEGIEGYFYGNV